MQGPPFTSSRGHRASVLGVVRSWFWFSSAPHATSTIVLVTTCTSPSPHPPPWVLSVLFPNTTSTTGGLRSTMRCGATNTGFEPDVGASSLYHWWRCTFSSSCSSHGTWSPHSRGPCGRGARGPSPSTVFVSVLPSIYPQQFLIVYWQWSSHGVVPRGFSGIPHSVSCSVCITEVSM